MALPERTIQNQIYRWLGTNPNLRVWRQNTGGARLHGQYVAFGVPGAADLTGILPDGRRLEIEVKSSTGRQSKDQKNYEALINRFGGLYVLARSVEDVKRALEGEGYGEYLL